MSDSEMNKFYTLKSKYEDSISKEKKKILNSNKSLEEKRDEFKKLRPKCVNCKRPVGTLFKRDYDEEDYAWLVSEVCIACQISHNYRRYEREEGEKKLNLF